MVAPRHAHPALALALALALTACTPTTSARDESPPEPAQGLLAAAPLPECRVGTLARNNRTVYVDCDQFVAAHQQGVATWTPAPPPVTATATTAPTVTTAPTRSPTASPEPSATAAPPTVPPTSTATSTPTLIPPPTDCLGVPAYPEVRPENATANANPQKLPPWPIGHWNEGYHRYYDRVTGDCHGSTRQILEWAAKKWGFSDQPSALGGPALFAPDALLASAVVESYWRQAQLGDAGDSFGILQARRPYWPGAYETQYSTALNADYVAAAIRAHFDGATWIAAGTTGNLEYAVSGWNTGECCGRQLDGSPGPTQYLLDWRQALADKPWRRW